MSNSKGSSGPLVVLNAPVPDLKFIVFNQSVHDTMAINASVFTAPSPTLVIYQTDITAYQGSQVLVESRTKGAAQARTAKRIKVKNDLGHLRDYVQSVVQLQTSWADAEAVAKAAFMSLRQIGVIDRQELTAANTGISGSVKLDAKAVAPDAVYYWAYSLDQVNWSSAPDTMKHITVITGLTTAKVYYFRFQALTRKGLQSWSQIVSLLVH